jgi:hypothetical protein
MQSSPRFREKELLLASVVKGVFSGRRGLHPTSTMICMAFVYDLLGCMNIDFPQVSNTREEI